MVSKTRDKLIEVARQLFTKKGVENTTMNDIAAASEKVAAPFIPILRTNERFTMPSLKNKANELLRT